jgi:cytochrome P450
VKILPVELLQRNRWLPFYRQMHALNESLYSLIAAGRRETAAVCGENVLADLLAASHDDGEPLGDEEIRDALLTLIIAGHDTTSIALAWALEQIVPRPDVVERITDELRRTKGGAPAEQLNRLEYLDAAIRELECTILAVRRSLDQASVQAGGREYPPGVVLCLQSPVTPSQTFIPNQRALS